MPLDREVDLGPADIVLDGAQLPLLENGVEPQIFGPSVVWPNGWVD